MTDFRLFPVEPTSEARLRQMVRDAYNAGFGQGMREHTSYNGGITWSESSFRKELDELAAAPPQPAGVQADEHYLAARLRIAKQAEADLVERVEAAEAQLVEEQAETARWLDKAARLQAQVATAEEQLAKERAKHERTRKVMEIQLRDLWAADGHVRHLQARIAVLEAALRRLVNNPSDAEHVARSALAASSEGQDDG